jgi:type IV secretion system protein VirD4
MLSSLNILNINIWNLIGIFIVKFPIQAILLFVVLPIIGMYILINGKSLDGIKGSRVGDGQHGDARFLTPREIKRDFTLVKFEPEKWRDAKEEIDLPQGTVLGLVEQHTFLDTFTKKRLAIVDKSDSNTLVIAPAGMGKTFYFLLPQIEYAAAAKMSFVVTDTKGNAHSAMASVLENHYGYKVYLFDLRNPLTSESYNMMQIVNHYMDLSKQNNCSKESLVYEAKAQKYAKIVSKSIVDAVGKGTGDNSFWYETAEGLLTSTILIISEFAKKEERHIMSVFKMMQELARSTTVTDPKNPVKTEYSDLIKMLPENHKAKWFAGASLEAGINVTLNTFSTALSRLTKFIDSEL